MNNLLIVGAGGHGKVVSDAAFSMGCWDNIAFLDAKYPDLKEVIGYSVIGSVDQAVEFLKKYPSVVVAVGDNNIRMNLMDDLVGKGFSIPVIIHRSAWVSPSASLGEGSVVFANAVINASAQLGRGTVVNTSSIIEHDCCLGDGVHICPGVCMGGGVTIGNRSFIGVGSSIIHSVDLGVGVTVGAGAVVAGNIQSGFTVVGVPAKQIVK